MKFPIVLCKENRFHVYHDPAQVSKTTMDMVDSGWFKDWLIYDMDNQCYRLKDMKVVGKAGWIGTWHPKYPGKLVKVAFDTEPHTFDLEALKQCIEDDLTAHAAEYEALEGFNGDEILKGVRKANDVATVIESL